VHRVRGRADEHAFDGVCGKIAPSPSSRQADCVGGCEELDWNPIASASSYSALTAVLAGFVFTGIIVIVTERAPAAGRVRTLTLFLSALVVLGFGSYLDALIAGEIACLRAWSVGVVASGLLGLGAVNIFVGLAWLLDTYVSDDETGQQITITTAGTCFGVALAVGALLTVTFAGFWGDSYGSIPGWLHITLASYGLMIAAGMTALFVRWYRSPLARDGSDDTATRMAAVDRAVRTGGAAAAAYTIISAIATGVVVYIPNQRWDPVPNRWLPATVGIISLLVPTAVLVLQVLALPPRHAAAPAAVTPP
jgi:hypothetical protein